MTTEAKHTPGPWVIDPLYLSEVQTEDRQTIASCWHEHAEGKTIDLTGIFPCSLEESAANARLIAAAPELLAELEAILTDLSIYGFINQRRLNAAKAAVAKARS